MAYKLLKNVLPVDIVNNILDYVINNNVYKMCKIYIIIHLLEINYNNIKGSFSMNKEVKNYNFAILFLHNSIFIKEIANEFDIDIGRSVDINIYKYMCNNKSDICYLCDYCYSCVYRNCKDKDILELYSSC